ncbi:DUF1573 domain-containing protein [Flavobacterium sp. N3904]|uniref:DUF1573 domain-containing protein n=1 Tax=Flavobacterium sp. N3904 TaxID=2986835 RepID=UPI00222404B7|nr:DUF1573 domain-containing protein [Flavobacterium sp. N3904]
MNKKAIHILLVLVTILLSSCKNNTDSAKNDGKFPEITFSKKTYDFGSVNQGDIVETEFEFTNSGNKDLLITQATGSCGCTIPDFPKRAIQPGESEKIKVSFNSTGKSGMQNKTVTIESNTKAGIETVNITANVIPRTGIAQ